MTIAEKWWYRRSLGLKSSGLVTLDGVDREVMICASRTARGRVQDCPIAGDATHVAANGLKSDFCGAEQGSTPELCVEMAPPARAMKTLRLGT